MWGTIAMVATQAGTALLSGAQAVKMRTEQQKAEQAASNLMKDVYSLLDKNQYAAVSLPMKAYEIEREALASQGAQAVEAGRESERTAAATAGLTMSQFRKGLRDIQSEQADKMLELDLLTAQEAARKDDIKAQFKAQEAEGAQMAAADYEQRKLAAVGGAIQSGIGAVGAGIEAIPLYKATKGVKAVSNLEDMYSKAVNQGTLKNNFLDAEGNPYGFSKAISNQLGLTTEKLTEMGMLMPDGSIDAEKFKTWLSGKSPEEINSIILSFSN